MASSQQVLFAETVIAMKKAIKRKAYGKELADHYFLGQRLMRLGALQNPTQTKKLTTMATEARS